MNHSQKTILLERTFYMDSIIFDVDGTLWDSTEIVAKAWTDYLKVNGIAMEITSQRLKQLFGQLLPDIAKQLFTEAPEEEQLRLIDGCCLAEHEALLRQCAPLYPGLENTLKTLYQEYPLFIVSNCQAGYIEVFLEATGFSHYFKGHLCPGDTGKEKAGNIRQIMETHHLSDPIYVGDTMGDYKACQKAGVSFVHASYGFGSVPEGTPSISSLPDLLSFCGV